MLEIIEERPGMWAMKEETVGEYAADEVKENSERCKTYSKKPCGIRAAAMTWKSKRFYKTPYGWIEKSNIVFNNCIVHRENLFSKILEFEGFMKKVTQSINFNRSRVINHWQFKAMPYLLSKIIVLWLSVAAALKRFLMITDF